MEKCDTTTTSSISEKDEESAVTSVNNKKITNGDKIPEKPSVIKSRESSSPIKFRRF
ncbi:11086_t:CDS:1, partial [Rhizophagus irregularis]